MTANIPDPRIYDSEIAAALTAAETAAANGANRETIRAALTKLRIAEAARFEAHQRWAFADYAENGGWSSPGDWLIASAVADAIKSGYFHTALDVLERVHWDASVIAQIKAIAEAHDRLW